MNILEHLRCRREQAVSAIVKLVELIDARKAPYPNKLLNRLRKQEKRANDLLFKNHDRETRDLYHIRKNGR